MFHCLVQFTQLSHCLARFFLNVEKVIVDNIILKNFSWVITRNSVQRIDKSDDETNRFAFTPGWREAQTPQQIWPMSPRKSERNILVKMFFFLLINMTSEKI